MFNTVGGCFDDPNAPRCTVSNGNAYGVLHVLTI